MRYVAGMFWEHCSLSLNNYIFQLDNENVKLRYFTSLMTSLMDGLCSCRTAGYLGDTLMVCDKAYHDEVVIQGRIVGTPTVSNNQMINQLQSFVMNVPSPIVYQGQTLTYIQRCSVEITLLGEASCNSLSEQSTTQPVEINTRSTSIELSYKLIGGVAGGVALLIIIVVVTVIAVVIFKKIRRGKSYNKGTKDTLEM